MNEIRVCQFEPIVGDVAANIDTIANFCADTHPADVTVFPELCVSGYDVEVAASVAEPIPGPITDQLVGIAERTNQTMLVGLPEQSEGEKYNSVVVVDKGGVQATYRKQHRWGAEQEQFEPGTAPVTVETPVGRLGLLVGYDLNFPEQAVAYADAGCDVLVTIAAWQSAYGGDWDLLLRTRALETPAYMVGCNHVGKQGDRTHSGQSLISDPHGHVVVEAGHGPESVSAAIDKELLGTARNYNPVQRTRDRSRRSDLRPEICPECDHSLDLESGIIVCPSCSWYRQYPAD